MEICEKLLNLTEYEAFELVQIEYVLVKGGHRVDDANDLLYNGENYRLFEGKRIETKNTHGTGCTLSSAVASFRAQGYSMQRAIESAKAYVTQAITDALNIGHGAGGSARTFHGTLSKSGSVYLMKI